VGRASASSAQSKRRGTGAECSGTGLGGVTAGDGDCETTVVGGSDGSAVVENAGSGETARLWSNWGELGWMGVERDAGGERGVLGGADGVVGDAGGAYHTDDAQTARLRGVWGELGGWNELWGCSDRPGGVSRHFRAVASGLERGRAGVSVIDDDDVAVAFGGSRCGTGDRGANWGEQSGVGGCSGRRWRWWGWHSCSVECTTRSDERVRTTSCDAVFGAVDRRRTSFTVCW
jgi:hypothetical protein